MNFDKALVNVQAFLPDDDEILTIIRICNLKPTKSWKKWGDSYGNSLILRKDKSVSFVANYSNDNRIFDLNFKAPIKNIADKSKWALISFAKSQKEINNYTILFSWFLGKDDILRLSVLIKDEWIENQPPLLSGVMSLREVAKNIGKTKSINVTNLYGPHPSKITKAWATVWPPPTHIKLDMLLSDKMLAQKLLETTGEINKNV